MKVFLASLQTGSKQETKSFEERYMTDRLLIPLLLGEKILWIREKRKGASRLTIGNYADRQFAETLGNK
jgi:hypothetical protein